MARTPLIQRTIRASIEADSSAATCKLPSTRTHARPSERSLTQSPRRRGRGSTWDGEAERRRGLQVDDQLEPRRLLHRQIGRVFSLQDPAGVKAELMILLSETGTIAGQAAL